jgi:hypothetical protein
MELRIPRKIILLAFLLFASFNSVCQTIVYTNDFSAAVESEWNATARKRSITPSGSNWFLGRFASEGVFLSLTNLPAHEYITIEYDLYIIDAWDGNGVSGNGPDVFYFKENGKQNLMVTSFSTHDLNNSEVRTQSYPGSYPYDQFHYGAGASKTNNLGYTNWAPRFGFTSFGSMVTNKFGYYWKPNSGVVSSLLFDTTYRIRHAFPNNSESIKLVFGCSSPENRIDDESWGLDNIVVGVLDTPSIKPPDIVQEPVGVTNSSGRPFAISVVSDGYRPLFYQWYKDGVNIPFATNASFRVVSSGSFLSGNYQVLVSNIGGSVTSSIASVEIVSSGTNVLRKASAKSETLDGLLNGVIITEKGYGYLIPPAVIIQGGGGVGATAIASVSNGQVTGFVITNPGSGYTSDPIVQIASPPFAPKLGVQFSKVLVQMSVVLGRKYQLESSTDLNTWTNTGPAFIAQDEDLVQEFDVNQVGRYFRINQVP